ASYSTGVNTGWKYGMAGATSPAPSSPPAAPGNAVLSAGGAAPHAAPEPATAPVQNDPGPPVATDITVRLVDAVNPSSGQPQGHYRAVVTQAATAGSVHIPVNTLAAITAVQQSPGNFSTQLVSLKINGQDMPVTSTPVNATSATQDVAKKIGGLLSGFGKHGAQISSATNAVGNHAAIPPGTTFTFSTSVPQPGPSTPNTVP